MPAPARVLVVEDEWLIAEDHAAHLREAGHLVVGPFASVEAALAAIEAEPIDAALLDIELREETSYAVADRLEERGIPFAFVSGYSEQDLPPRLSGRELIGKPVEQARLLAAVERMVGLAGTESS